MNNINNTNDNKIITVIGGSGFVGTAITKLLAQHGYRIRVIVRDTETASHLYTLGDVGQVEIISGDMSIPDSISPHLTGSYAVINAVGILFEKSRQCFHILHDQAVGDIAKAAKAAKVKRFVHISALGASESSPSLYAKSKARGEERALHYFPDATILRPSVIFGCGDNFINKFADMADKLPVILLPKGGKTLFQPIYVGDVAKACLAAIERSDCQGRIYELGGNDILSLADIIEYIFRLEDSCGYNNTAHHKKKRSGRRKVLPLPMAIAYVIGFFAGFLPNPPITVDQVRLLKQNSIVSNKYPTLADLGIEATPMNAIVPKYL